ncbi:hypothetical protein GCM10022296_15370 [Secundilactobacillus similis DSM 23365 = JCM 2765]|nr:diguanylate cyclase [Secundilactobacillus similis]
MRMMVMNLHLLSLPMFITQLIIASIFMSGFVSLYQELGQFLGGQKANWARIGSRVLLMVFSLGVGSLFHFMGYYVYYNAMMFHNMGLFILVFTMFDTDLKIWEYLIRAIALISVWSMHHMGHFDRPQFAISLILLGIALIALQRYGKQFRYNIWLNGGLTVYISIAFWLLLPRVSAGMQVSTAICMQAILMFILMDVAASNYWLHRHRVGVETGKMAQLVNYDSLTNAKTYALYQHEITTLFNDAKQRNEPLTLVALDVDHFKQINDYYGHLAGNDVLVGVAQTLEHVLEKYGYNRYVYRTGGEEFNIVFADKRPDDVMSIIDECWHAVQKAHYSYEEYDINVTISMGVTAMTDQDASVEDIYRRADDNLYQSKRNGRNTVTVDGETRDRNHRDAILSTYVFCPQSVMKVTADGEATPMSNELLLRNYSYEHRRWVVPEHFQVSVKTQIDLMTQLLDYKHCFSISMNLDEAQFIDPATPKALAAFRKAQPTLDYMVVEMEEWPSLTDLKSVLAEYRQADIKLVIDDVALNTNLEELDYLLPYVDGLKFTMTANDVARDRERLQTRLVYWSRIAKQYDLLFVVKGVENQEEVDWLQEHQITAYMQGYYFDRPVLPRVE